MCEQWEIAVTRKGQVNLKWINFSNRPSPGSHPVAQMIQFNTELKRETRKQNGRFPKILQDDSFLWLQGICKHLRKNERDSGLIIYCHFCSDFKLWGYDLWISILKTVSSCFTGESSGPWPSCRCCTWTSRQTRSHSKDFLFKECKCITVSRFCKQVCKHICTVCT